ncbi:MAG: hypothetical protein ACRD30_07205, partial [Bryobacteraceae bacterium]
MNSQRVVILTAIFSLMAIPGIGQQRAERRQPRIPSATDRYALYLADPPVAARFSAQPQLATPAAATYRSQIVARQQNVRQALASRNIRVTGSVSTLLNAIFVAAPASRVADLRSIPG